MPGIVGLLTEMPRDWAEAQLLRMVGTMRHEPYYRAGTWIDESSGVYVGWIAREGSFSDAMPLQNETGDLVLVFSGEDFPGSHVKPELRARGHRFQEAGPSYLVHLSEHDPQFPACLNGRFHGLLVDRRRGTSTLFVDRYGMQRLYYHESKEALYFSAEAKAILAVRPALRSVDAKGVGEFVTCGCVFENRTLFPGVHVLPASSAWVCRGCSVEQRRAYFDPAEWESQARRSPEESYDEIRDVFSRVLPRYFDGPERVGLSLTGGLDTRMIMAWWKPPAGSLPCYTFGGTYNTSQDVIIGRRVASTCGQPHEEIRVGAEFLSDFHRFAERTVYLSDGCADVSASAVLYTNALAREIAPVRMTGNYGSQILRPTGPSFKPGHVTPGLFASDLEPHFVSACDTYNRLLLRGPLSFIVFCQAPWYHYGLYSIESSQLSVRSPFLDNELVRAAFRSPKSALTSGDVSLRLIADGSPALAGIRTDRGVAGHQSGMAASVRRAFLEFTFKAEYAYDYGMPQWVARIDHALSALHLERLFLGRHKYAHYRVWYRDALADYVQEVLLDPRTLSRPIWNRTRVEALVNAHLKSGGNCTSDLHVLLSLELVHRLFVD
jgi:asparagine synthase (glutamine-hydrolysing)